MAFSLSDEPDSSLPIIEHEGNLLNISHGIIVHGCNAHGAMGAGVALSIRKKWPEVFNIYHGVYAMQGNRLILGQCIPVPVENGSVIVVNAITQENTGTHQRQVDYDAISAVFSKVAILAKLWKMPVHFPLIGCGLAGGDWAEVSKRIIKNAPLAEKHLWTFKP